MLLELMINSHHRELINDNTHPPWLDREVWIEPPPGSGWGGYYSAPPWLGWEVMIEPPPGSGRGGYYRAPIMAWLRDYNRAPTRELGSKLCTS